MREDASDDEAISRTLEGDRSAFETLVRRHAPAVFRVAGRHVPADEVENVAQEVFLEAFRSLGSFRKESPFEHWIVRIAVRACYRYWRGRYRAKEIPISALSAEHQRWIEGALAAESAREFTTAADRKAAVEVLRQAMNRLKPEERTVLTLVAIEERSIAEAAKLLGLTSVNVKVRLFRSRRRLREVFERIVAGERK
jgi:RNA polymerase sigma-70 factor (ECF subfamily)